MVGSNYNSLKKLSANFVYDCLELDYVLVIWVGFVAIVVFFLEAPCIRWFSDFAWSSMPCVRPKISK